jgi:glutathione synthase/RimK-type ligase-like ATP-grasp enzyme
MVMVLASTDDLAADLLVLALRRRGTPFVRVNDDRFPTDVQITWSPIACSVWLGDREIPFGALTGVWCRGLYRFARGRLTSAAGVDRYVAREAYAALYGAAETAPPSWMNKPSATASAESKPLQLRTAIDVGFRVPGTLISNRPAAIRDFVRQSSAVAKTLSGTRVVTGQGADVLYTQTLPDFDDVEDGELAASPAIYQRRIDKAFDVRITIVGKKIFAVRLFTPSEPVDWRAAPDADVRYEPCTLDGDVAAKCFALVERFGLRYGAIDMVVDTRGDWFFLELNPAGQWGWLERTTGLRITDAIVDELEYER